MNLGDIAGNAEKEGEEVTGSCDSAGKSGEQLPYFLLLEQTPYQPYHLGQAGSSSPISCFWSRHITNHNSLEKRGAAPLFPAFGADTLPTTTAWKSGEQLPYFLLLEQTHYQPQQLGKAGSSSPISCFWSRHITNHNNLEKRGAAPLFPTFRADTLPTTTTWKSGEQLPYFLLLEQTPYQPYHLGQAGSSSPISCFWSRYLANHIHTAIQLPSQNQSSTSLAVPLCFSCSAWSDKYGMDTCFQISTQPYYTQSLRSVHQNSLMNSLQESPPPICLKIHFQQLFIPVHNTMKSLNCTLLSSSFAPRPTMEQTKPFAHTHYKQRDTLSKKKYYLVCRIRSGCTISGWGRYTIPGRFTWGRLSCRLFV